MITNMGKELKISKNRFNISMEDRWNVRQLISDSLDAGLHLSNISEVRNFRTSRMYGL